MIVVADTSPLRYLVAIEHDFLLPILYGRVLIPSAVADELNHESTPKVVRAWLAGPPGWLEIRQPTSTLAPEVDLDRGEREAIALAEEVAADQLPRELRTIRIFVRRVPARHERVISGRAGGE